MKERIMWCIASVLIAGLIIPAGAYADELIPYDEEDYDFLPVWEGDWQTPAEMEISVDEGGHGGEVIITHDYIDDYGVDYTEDWSDYEYTGEYMDEDTDYYGYCEPELEPTPEPMDNLLPEAGDSDFEAAGRGGWLDYDFGPQFGRDYDATDQSHSGDQSLKLWATGEYDDPNKWEMSGAKQIYPVNPGDVISGGAWLKWQDLDKVEAYVESKWLDASQKELTSVPPGYVPGLGTVHKTTGSGDWEYQDLNTWTTQERTAPPDTKYVDFRLNLLAAGTADVAKGTVWWDDAQFMVIPGGADP